MTTPAPLAFRGRIFRPLHGYAARSLLELRARYAIGEILNKRKWWRKWRRAAVCDQWLLDLESGWIAAVTAIDGRCVVFPNTLQHRVESFQLTDKTRPGVRKNLAFFVVDPTKRIPSTAVIPPRQTEWVRVDLDPVLKQLEQERLSDNVIAAVESFLGPRVMTRDEAKVHRLGLMAERQPGVSKETTSSFSHCVNTETREPNGTGTVALCRDQSPLIPTLLRWRRLTRDDGAIRDQWLTELEEPSVIWSVRSTTLRWHVWWLDEALSLLYLGFPSARTDEQKRAFIDQVCATIPYNLLWHRVAWEDHRENTEALAARLADETPEHFEDQNRKMGSCGQIVWYFALVRYNQSSESRSVKCGNDCGSS